MSQPNSKRLVLSSVNQVIMLVRNNPILAQQLPKLAQLNTMSMSTTPQKSCNCGSKVNFVSPDPNKQVAESTLSSLTSQDFSTIKTVLGLNELCYYKRNTEQNKLELICV